jgi:hypothetical protein
VGAAHVLAHGLGKEERRAADLERALLPMSIGRLSLDVSRRKRSNYRLLPGLSGGRAPLAQSFEAGHRPPRACTHVSGTVSV